MTSRRKLNTMPTEEVIKHMKFADAEMKRAINSFDLDMARKWMLELNSAESVLVMREIDLLPIRKEMWGLKDE